MRWVAPGPDVQAIVHSSTALLLLQVLCILAVSRAAGWLLRHVHQPLVVAEIVAGIALGPSLLGQIAPGVLEGLFPAESLAGLNATSQLGLVLFMFIVGLEFDGSLLRRQGGVALAVSQLSILTPFLLGGGLAWILYDRFAPEGLPFSAFALFMAASLSVTAFPVLARILSERGLLQTRVGALTLTAAAVNDVTAWCMLAFVIAVVRSGGVLDAVRTTGLALAFVAVMVGLVRPFLARVAARFGTDHSLSQAAIAVIVLLLLLSALAAEAIGIHALFGAFLFGAVVPRDRAPVRVLVERFEDVVVVVLLPLFFAFTGLRTTIGLVDTPERWFWCAVIIGVATAGKVLGSTLPARAGGMSWRDSATIGVLMNTRGLMELIILNIGLDLGVLTPLLFTMLVIMAVATTFITTPLVRLLYPPERVLAERQAAATPSGGGVVAAVSHPDSVPGLARLVVALCAGGTGPAWALRLIPLGDRASLFPENAPDVEHTEDDTASALAQEAATLGVRVEPQSFPSADPAESIVDFARLRGASVVLLGLHKPLLGHARLGGPILAVAQHAPGDVGILHDRGLTEVRRVLLALGGAQEPAARRFAARLGAASGIQVDTFPGAKGTGSIAELVTAARTYDLVIVGSGPEWELPMTRLELRAPPLLEQLPTSLLIAHGRSAA